MINMMRQELVRGLVQHKITCAFTGRALDYRQCGVVLDKKGEPVDVFHESAVDRVRARVLEGYSVEVAPFS